MLTALLPAVGSIVGGLLQSSANKKAAERANEFTREVGQNQIQWKVADAKKAGVHPLAAMGQQLTLPSPSVVGAPDYSTMGQNLGRAFSATQSLPEKESDYTKTVQALDLKRRSLENSVIEQQLVNSAVRTVNQPGNPPTADPVDESPLLKPKKKDDATGVTVGGTRFKGNPNFSDAQTIEDRHGELAGSAYGAISIPADLYWKLKHSRYGYMMRQADRMYGNYYNRTGRGTRERGGYW